MSDVSRATVNTPDEAMAKECPRTNALSKRMVGRMAAEVAVEFVGLCYDLERELNAKKPSSAARSVVTLPAVCPFDARQFLEGKTGVDFIAGWDAMIEKMRRAASSPSTAAITVPAEAASGYEATIMQLERDLECAREALIETQQELNRLRHGPAQYTNAGFCALLRRRGEEDAAREIERLERELARLMSSATKGGT
jgi:hypothetical protein